MFVRIMNPKPGMKILDVGGLPQIWDHVAIPLDITCLNLPGMAEPDHKTHHTMTYVDGDACNMPEYHTDQFDMVFSNSTIEHVGDYEKRVHFAKEVRRLSKKYWIQTPYKYYPIEAHCGMPFWWLYPEALRAFFINRWRKSLPAWTEMVATTTIISVKEMKELFPECTLKKEWVILPKSLIAYSVK